MRLNWRKGFNRIFALAVLGWAVYVAFVYPGKQYDVSLRNLGKADRVCVNLTGYPRETVQATVREVEACFDAAQKDSTAYIEGTSFLNALRDRRHAANYAFGLLLGPPGGMPTPERRFDWLGVLIVLCLIVLPPALLYGLIEVCWRVGRWVARGFVYSSG